MKKYFYGQEKKKTYFEGWYFKQQNRSHTLALIPAFHVDAGGRREATLQVITGERAWSFVFPIEDFRACRGRLAVRVGENLFSERGIRLDLHGNGLDLAGTIRFGRFTPPRKPLMGPFAVIPGMQCSHEVLSLFHRLKGRVLLNGEEICFDGGKGYLEKDRGSSFPKNYVWTQCSFMDRGPGCIMAAAADVPLGPGAFTGCICAVLYRGRQYRFATYTGARIVQNTGRSLVIRQGCLELRIMALEENGQQLQAPQGGVMQRVIRESASCLVRYEMWKGEERIFRIVSGQAGWERD